MHRLAELATLSRSGTTRLIDRIEAEGLVERRACPSDRRGLEVVLTAQGRELQERAAPVALRGIQEHFGRHLDDHGARRLAELLEQVVASEMAAAAVTPREAGAAMPAR
jgi:DNA-binding MarR family transcriptional regulator